MITSDTAALATLRLRDSALDSDRDVVLQLVAATGVFHDNELPVAVEVLDARLQQGHKAGYEFLFAEVGDDSMGYQVVGYACYGLNEMTVNSWELYWIAVDPAQQGMGVGRSIMDEVHRRICRSGGGRICLDTSGRAQYEKTRGFYMSNGYRVVARLADYYAPGDDKLILQKDIPCD